jgi:mycofactocin system transcriptional regulator
MGIAEDRLPDLPRVGRRPATSHAELEKTAFALFSQRGFDETSIDDIAAGAGIARRTFFRYYPSKTDLVWGDFDAQLVRLRSYFDALAPGVAMMNGIHDAVLEFNRLPPGQETQHRLRMSLILGVPTLLANSTLRFVQWRAVVAGYAARRLGSPADGLVPSVIGYSTLGATLAGYELWLRSESADLDAVLDESLAELAIGFQHRERA